jgi:hypothetical protein
MAAGEREFTESTRGGLRAPRRRLLLLALALTAAVGCGRSSSDPSEAKPPLPRYWHGSTEDPEPEAWAAAWPPDWSLNDSTRVGAPAPIAGPYDVPQLPSSALTHPQFAEQAIAPRESLAAAPIAVPVYADDPPKTASFGTLLPPEPMGQPAPGPADPRRHTPLQFPSEPAGPAATARAPQRETAGDAARHTAAAQPSPGAPTGVVVNERATTRIRRGFELAERGAYFAARHEFVDVLHMIASAKDQMHGAPRRTIALADGLRALDEAADFSPVAAGAGELRLSVIVASHQTPVAKSLAVDGMLPEQLADAYLEYAGRQLGAAVAGEPTGSMALHALGKLHSRLGRVEPEQNPQAERYAFAMQQAALLARSDNHFAAHEIGVLLAEGGHFAESGLMLRQVAERAPDPVVFRNLARVENQLGRPDLAAASQRQAELLAARSNSAGAPVQWVPPASLARTPDPLAPPANPMMARDVAPVVR